MTIDYRDILAKTLKDLEDFKNEVQQIAEEEGMTSDEAFNSLDIFEIEYYELLIKRLELLRHWEATDRVFGAYRRAELRHG